ncbi:MAG: purine-cytosine permease family protein [Pirellulaceae bacterium]
MTEDELQPSSEFEREPVPEQARLGFKSFVGMYAGEHVAGTELMIGPLFIASGVSAFDLIAGLLLGNLLAVLSWVFLTAPIATRARLTLYYQLEQICGRGLVILYNLANGVMFCFLAGAMITVAATALGPIFQLRMPALTDTYPNSLGWVVATLAVGTAISIVAAFGYQSVSKFANIAAPWMVLIFLAFGIIAARRFLDSTDVTVASLNDVWTLADTVIWKGGDPLPGQTKFTFWHVTFFAWFCNMAMHIGMSDLSVFRFARKSWYGVASGAGMYIGHFMAWISASMLFAYQLNETHPDDYMVQLLQSHSAHYAALDPDEIKALPLTSDLLGDAMQVEAKMVAAHQMQEKEKRIQVPTPLPGELAYGACGIAGLLCVIFAGWTTANPTIYRAGLAFQAVVPRTSRFVVTLITGGLATIAGMFPGIAMKLLDFVAIYGMVLMPMGAVVFVDYWLMRKLGLHNNYAAVRGIPFNWAAGWTWVLTLATCLFLTKYADIEIFFVSLPGWFIAAILYVVLSKLFQKQFIPER